jgi:GT2 family glycosyltransferase/glycosyltransferase involved in cell wall biosynthesis
MSEPDCSAGTRLAVLMTCHNRRAFTISSLRSLYSQDCPDARLSVFLVDDASTDGTSEQVRAEFPAVRLFSGGGDLYWSGGMRLAEEQAVQTDPDFLLWLNDDVTLCPGAIGTLLATYRGLVAQGKIGAIVVGAMVDPTTGLTSYSGLMRPYRLRRMRFDKVEPGNSPVEVETVHGNLVLIPRAVYRRVGPLDSGFTHKFCDFDYGLRARSLGCEAWIAPGHLGNCAPNAQEQPWLDRSRSLSARVRLLCSPKGLPPREWWRFVRRHGGVLAPLLFATHYARFLFSAFGSRLPEGGRRALKGGTERLADDLSSSSADPRRGCASTGHLRVLHVLDVLRPSGLEVMLEVAAPFWADHDIESQILTVAAVSGPFSGRLSSAGYRIHQLRPTPRREMLRGFARLLDAEAIDVVHLHVERANFWLGAIARARGIGVVYTSHANFPFTGTLRVERVLQRALGRKMGIRYTSDGASVALNEATRFFNKTTVFSAWCDLGHFCPPTTAERLEARRRLGIDTEFVIVSIGNCAEVKNHQLLLRALSECDDFDYVYLHAGDHSGATGACEVELSRTLGLAERVRFLGQVDDVCALLHAADLFVMPSLSEGLSIASVEALGCGLPLLLTDVPGLSDFRRYGGDIRYVDLDATAMARAIRSVIGNARARAATAGPSQMDDSLRSALDPSEGVVQYARSYWSTRVGPHTRRDHSNH